MEITILEKNIMDKIAILIPCYNEEKTIEKVVKDWKKELPDAVVSTRIITVICTSPAT